MLQFYRIRHTTYHNGEIISSRNTAVILTDKDVSTETYEFTWENLEKLYQEHGFECSFNIWNFKKGRRISFFTNTFFKKNHRDVKEWKHPNLNITLVIEYTPFEPSISYVLDWHNAEAALQYLEERKIKIIKTLDKITINVLE